MDFDARRVTGSVVTSLVWYFNQAEAEMGIRSNYGGMIYRLAVGRRRSESIPVEITERVLDSVARSRHVERALKAMEPDDREVIWLAFGAPWPPELGEYGEFAALAPTTRSAQEAHQATGTALPLLPWLERIGRRLKDPSATQIVMRIRRESGALRRRAISAYLDARRKVGPRG